MPFEALATELNELAARGLTRRRRTLEGPQGAQVQVDGRPLLAFASNDYLGLASHPELIAAAQEGAARYGVGSGASHLVLGHSAVHQALEEALAAFVAMPRALLFSTGYMANIGILTALAGRDDAVFADKLNHASLNDAALLSGAAFKRYPHCDTAALKRRLAASHARRRLIVTDAVFSMDGDIAPLVELTDLAERYDAWLVVDDAHGFGVLGAEGRGTLDRLDVHSPRIICMGTLGKAAGVYGAFVAAQHTVIETLMQRARAYIYTTATPPLLAHVLLRSLALIRAEQWRRDRLTQHIALLKSRVADSRFRLLPSDTAIQPLIVGDNDAAVAASEALLADGILVPAIRPPTVPVNTARLRISLSAAHDAGDIERLAAALNRVQ